MKKSRRVLLNYPPASSVWHLPAGIAMLAGQLKQEGHEVVQRYGHIIGLEHLLAAREPIRIHSALEIVRSNSSDIDELFWARTTLEDVSLKIKHSENRFVVERNNVVYNSRSYDGRIPTAVEATQDDNLDDHLWASYFRQVELPFAADFRPDVYGVSVSDERHVIPGIVLASMIKKVLPNCVVVLGGNFWSRVITSANAQAFGELLDPRNQVCDAIIYAEGFQPMLKIVETLDPASAPGTSWRRDNGDVVVNPRPSRLTSFQELPTPIYDGFARQWAPETVYPLYTMSNCLRQCSFCAISAGSDTFRGGPRVMSVDRIADHMIALGGRFFDFTDELMPIQRSIHLGNELKKRGYPAEWQCYTTITKDLLNPALCQRLYDAGCRAVQLGLESLTPSTLAAENKGWNNPDTYGQILSNLAQAGIHTHVFLIVGIPGERHTDTLRWLPFLEDYGEVITTVKSGRYRLAKGSPEEQDGLHSQLIRRLPDDRPLLLNSPFEYIGDRSLRKDTEAMRDLLEEACRHNPFYKATSTIPWWINRRRYTLAQLLQASDMLPAEASAPHLDRALERLGSIAMYERGDSVHFDSYEQAVAYARTL